MKKVDFKTLSMIFAAFLMSVGFISCDDNEGSEPEPEPDSEFVITDNITENTTWESGNTYILDDRIAVVDGVTLTIEPGVVVKGKSGSGANATALLIARGGKIMAEGTADSPIIFTAFADDIEPGMIASPNLDSGFPGLWGGLIVLGKAPISADAEAVQIEGIPASDQNGLYGGSTPNDNSGVIKYVSIRHGGANIGEGNEINGLTLGGVGSATEIHHIEIVANDDDGIECFGGTVDVSNILVWSQNDDAYDMDQAYSGTIDNFIYIGGPESDHGMELDGPEGSAEGAYTLKNGTLIGWNDEGVDGGEYADLRDGVSCTIINCYFKNFSESSDFEFDAGIENDNGEIRQNYLNGDVVLSGLEFNVSHLSGGNMTIENIFSDKYDGGDVFEDKAPGATIVTSPSVGADASVFMGWSWAENAGELSDI